MSLGKIIDMKNNDLSKRIDKQKVPEHIAIIMDGNGRWATKKGLPRTYGHKRGVNVLKEILKASKKLGCKVLTVYAFSTENWTRPTKEVNFLINLFIEVLKNEIDEIHEESTKIKFIGDLTPFPETLKKILKAAKNLGCKVITVYAFSTENWTRPSKEVDFLINLFATDTPLHDGAVLVKGNKIISAGVILPLSRQGISRYGTRHLAALGITERFDRCICIVVSEETGTLSLAIQGKLERPITSSRLQELLVNLIGNQTSMGTNKSSLGKNSLSQNTKPRDNIVSDSNEKDFNKSEIFTNKKD